MNSLPLWVAVLIGGLSGVFGSFLGPLLTRFITRSDKALDVRQVWAKEKLLTVFGLGEEPFYSDGPIPDFYFLTPPNGWRFHAYDMHMINLGVQESVDLMMLQPVRSKWARDWLYNWHFALQPRAYFLHQRMHQLHKYQLPEDHLEYTKHRTRWDKDNEAYERRVRRVESAFSRWASGQLSRPSILMWLANRKWVVKGRGFYGHLPKDYKAVSEDPASICNCREKNAELEVQAAEAQALWDAEQAALPANTDSTHDHPSK